MDLSHHHAFVSGLQTVRASMHQAIQDQKAKAPEDRDVPKSLAYGFLIGYIDTMLKVVSSADEESMVAISAFSTEYLEDIFNRAED